MSCAFLLDVDTSELSPRDSEEENSRDENKWLKTYDFYVRKDDDNAILVFTLPLIEEEEDVDAELSDYDEGDIVEKPHLAARAIFHGTPEESMLQLMGKDPIPAARYKKRVHDHLEELLQGWGYDVKRWQSIDKDEWFWKICLPPGSEVAKKLAYRFSYSMPFKEKTYIDVGMEGGIPQDTSGQKCPAFMHYKYEFQDAYEDFTDADLIRLTMNQLESCVNLSAMTKQELLIRHFPAAKCDEEDKLFDGIKIEGWGNICQSFTNSDVDSIRTYYGEEVAYVFRHFVFYVKNLRILAVPGLLCSLVELPWLGQSPETQNLVKLFFGIGLGFWAILVYQLWVNRNARCCERWGAYEQFMINIEERLENNKYWEPPYPSEIKPMTRRCLNCWGLLFQFFCVSLFIMTFTAAILSTNYYINNGGLRSSLGTLLTLVFSLSWSKLAFLLVKLDSHYTRKGFNASLVQRLAPVKIYLYLFPLFKIAFLEPSITKVCFSTEQQALDFMHSSSAFSSITGAGNATLDIDDPLFIAWARKNYLTSPPQPDLDVCPDSAPNFVSYAEAWVAHLFVSQGHSDEYCVPGTKAYKCSMYHYSQVGGTSLKCLFSNYWTLQLALVQLFFSSIALNSLYIAIPYFQVRWQARQEWKTASKRQENSEDGTEGDDIFDEKPKISWLELQGKRKALAPYAHLQWGGSYVEDYLTVILNFVLVTCFGIIAPYLLPIAYFAEMVEIRLLAFRMFRVTCRPFPQGTAGANSWLPILQYIQYASVLINGLLVLEHMRLPIIINQVDKLGFLFVYVVGSGLLKVCLPVLIPDLPADVRENHTYNDSFKRKFLMKRRPFP